MSKAAPVTLITEDYEMDFDMAELGRILQSPDLSREKLEGIMIALYPKLLEAQKQKLTDMFNSLVQRDDGLLFHCTAGKDRTGVSAFLVLSALGVDKQTAIADYMASNQYLDFHNLMPQNAEELDPKQAAMMKMFANVPKETLQPLMGVTQPLIDSVVVKMEAEHGSIVEYIKQELDVSDEDIQILRAKYMN